MSRIVHVCLSVRDALRWPKTNLKHLVVDSETGKPGSADDAREWLMDHLSQGHEVIPIGAPCEGFDWKRGCPGHECEDGK